MKCSPYTILAVLAVISLTSVSAQETAKLLPFQGRLTDQNGNAVSNGQKLVQFKIYDAPVGGRAVWNGEVQKLTVNGGLVNTVLGTKADLSAIDFNQSLYLEITVDANGDGQIGIADPPLLPRQSILPAVFAANSRLLANHDWSALFGANDPVNGKMNGSRIENNTITTAQIANGSIGAAQLADGTITGAKLNLSQGLIVGPDIAPGGTLRVGSQGAPAIWAAHNAGPQVYLASDTFAIGAFGDVGVVGGNVLIFTSPDGTRGGSLTVYGNATFNGNAAFYGSLTKPGGSFKIDHPLDPENKYLYHSFVESPDMKNIYDGLVELDSRGEAEVILPRWFGALNKEFRYQLTAIGAPGPSLHVAKEISDNRFTIAGGTRGSKVSWQVTGIRKDAWANAHRIPIEEDKPDAQRGTFLAPEEHGAPKAKHVRHVLFPEAALKTQK